MSSYIHERNMAQLPYYMSSYIHERNMAQLPYYKQVLRGMAYIDREHLNSRWYESIDLDALDMNYACDDVLTHTLGYAFRGQGMNEELGFYTADFGDALTRTWRAMLRFRSQLPPLPERHVFLGVGNENNTVMHDNVRHCFGWNTSDPHPEVLRWEKEWSPKGASNLSRNHVAYCAEREHPLAQELLINDTLLRWTQPQPEEKTMEDDYKAEIKIQNMGYITCYGYKFSPGDVEALQKFINVSASMPDASFDMDIAAIRIGCRRFDAAHIEALIRAYREKKAEEDNQIYVTTGSRLVRGGATYMVAQVADDDYLLVSVLTGNRWNSVIVKSPENRHNIPLKSFLTDSDSLSEWSEA